MSASAPPSPETPPPGLACACHLSSPSPQVPNEESDSFDIGQDALSMTLSPIADGV